MGRRSVVICGSKRFADELLEFGAALEKEGVVVYSPNFRAMLVQEQAPVIDETLRAAFKGLTLEHFEFIRKADLCLVFNPEGYCGNSVSLEIGFAAALGKPILAISKNTGDACRDALIDWVVEDIDDVLRFV